MNLGLTSNTGCVLQSSVTAKSWYLDYCPIPGLMFLCSELRGNRDMILILKLQFFGVHCVQYIARNSEEVKELCTWSLPSRNLFCSGERTFPIIQMRILLTILKSYSGLRFYDRS